MDASRTGASAKDGMEQNGAVAASSPTHAAVLQTAEEDAIVWRRRWNRRITIAAGLVTLIAAAVVLPPLINIGRYKHQVTMLMTRSLGRPVRMSSVGLRLLPLPGFVLHDLSVNEDPGFGAEPVLSAARVVATVNLLSLWGGRLEISRISVDEASLNLVRAADGRWNLDSLVKGAQPALTGRSRAPGEAVPRAYAHFPYLEATNSRVNLKFGAEKSPYSVTPTDLALWQDAPGQWRFRLKGQPVRTDISMSLADTGELRAEGSLHAAAQLRDMPLQLQIEWRDAQLGQLSRLLLGSDSGWRGGVTVDIEAHGTAENAQTRARLRVLGIGREEFAPQTALNFEANCTLRYQHSLHALHDLGCDTESGGGQLHLKAELPGSAGEPEGTLEVREVPLQAGLDLLRTVRSGFAPGISITGLANGSLTYKKMAQPADDGKSAKVPGGAMHHGSTHGITGTGIAGSPLDLRGSLVVEGAELRGDGLKEPLQLPRMTWTPAFVGANGVQTAKPDGNGGGENLGLSARFSVALGPGKAPQTAASQPATQATGKAGAGDEGKAKTAAVSAGTVASTKDSAAATSPLPVEAQAIAIQLGVARQGYEAEATGAASIARLRELAYAVGVPHLDAADSLSGSSAELEMHAAGSWLPPSDFGVSAAASPLDAQAKIPTPPASSTHGSTAVNEKARETPKGRSTARSAMVIEGLPAKDLFSGSLTLHHAQWAPSYLAFPVSLSQTAFAFSTANLSLTSDFTYGNAKETAKSTEAESPASPAPNAIPNAIHGSVTVIGAPTCQGADCQPKIQVRFGALDAGQLQAALLGTPQSKGFLAPFIDRVRPAQREKWPDFTVTVNAESLVLGPVTLQTPSVQLQSKGGDFLLQSWKAALLGGSAEGTGKVTWSGEKPQYSLDGTFAQINAAALGVLAGSHWSGGPLSGNGKAQLSGLTAKDLAASATGEVHFDWRHGTVSAVSGAPNGPGAGALRFDDWSGVATLAGGKAQLGQNAMVNGRESSTVAGVVPFGGPAKFTTGPPAVKQVARSGAPAQGTR